MILQIALGVFLGICAYKYLPTIIHELYIWLKAEWEYEKSLD